jgi:uncharacterized protein (TIGR04255 family)
LSAGLNNPAGSSFRIAPLVEVVADVRWSAPSVVSIPLPQRQGATPLPQLLLPTTQLEQFVFQFAAAIYNKGFQQAERLVPPGLPLPPGQPVMRFKRAAMSSDTVLYQIGQGMFATHAIAPYESWDKFSPFVSDGIDAMLGARPPTENAFPISFLSLHYINAFRGNLTDKRDIATCFSEIFKIDIKLPIAITRHMVAGKPYKPGLSLNMSVDRGNLVLNIGEAIIGGNPEPALWLDMLFTTTDPIVQPQTSQVMTVFNHAHKLLHDLFIELTKPIEHLMRPDTKS